MVYDKKFTDMMFICATNFHVGVQVGEEWVKKSIFHLVNKTPKNIPKEGWARFTFENELNAKATSLESWVKPSTGYIGFSTTLFENILCQLNIFFGYTMDKIPQTDFLHIPFFGGSEGSIGYQLKENLMLGFTGGIERICYTTSKLTRSLKNNWVEQEDFTKKMRCFVGPMLKHQIKKHIAFFTKCQYVQTMWDQKNAYHHHNLVKDSKSEWRVLAGLDFTF